MRNLLLTTTLILPLGLGAAFAQDAAPMTGTTETAPMTDMGAAPTSEPMVTETVAVDAVATAAADKVEVQQGSNEWRVDWITGTDVMSPTGETVGTINDLILNGDSGEMQAAIIGVGGFLGIGEKQIALPWSDLTINSDAREITSDLTREEAKAAPEYVFRDQETASRDMMTDPAADPMTAPAADPMATGTMATEPMETEPMETAPMETAPMDGTTTETMPAPGN